MHEFSVISRVVEALLSELEARNAGATEARRGGPAEHEGTGAGVGRVGCQTRKGVDNTSHPRIASVESVTLEVGELTMLSEEPLKFAWELLTENGPLRGSKLMIVRRPVVLECPACGYRGVGKPPEGLATHFFIPALNCPRCGGDVRVVGGRECLIREMRVVMEDGGEKSEREGAGGRRGRGGGVRGGGDGRGGGAAQMSLKGPGGRL
ncbi:MAG: hydrogenase maturation nickel metallochaperone HypA [Thermoplasmata archaeon]